MNVRVQTNLAWISALSLVLVAVGFGISGYVPPPPANDSAREIADFYISHQDRIRFGMIIAFVGFGGWAPLVALITVQMLRSGRDRPALAFLQAIAGVAGWMFLLLPILFLEIATFRAGDVSAETTQTLHDIGWITAFMPLIPFFVQNLAIAAAIFTDTSANPAYPRWLGYYNLWTAALFVPGVILIFFKTGPFAYHGLFVFWIPFAVFGAWILIMSWACANSAKKNPPASTRASSSPAEQSAAV